MKVKKLNEAKELCGGVFWDIDGELLAYPVKNDESIVVGGLSKNGSTYNHKKLWNELKPMGSKVPYNYYPRGRVDVSPSGNVTIYTNPNIGEGIIDKVVSEFGIRGEYRVFYDCSNHYKCHLDSGYVPQ